MYFTDKIYNTRLQCFRVPCVRFFPSDTKRNVKRKKNARPVPAFEKRILSAYRSFIYLNVITRHESRSLVITYYMNFAAVGECIYIYNIRAEDRRRSIPL